MNQWTQSETRYIDMKVWDACAGVIVKESLEGRTCYGGLDLSSTQDITALSLLFPDENKLHNLSWFWIPEDTMQEKERKDRVPYGLW